MNDKITVRIYGHRIEFEIKDDGMVYSQCGWTELFLDCTLDEIAELFDRVINEIKNKMQVTEASTPHESHEITREKIIIPPSYPPIFPFKSISDASEDEKPKYTTPLKKGRFHFSHQNLKSIFDNSNCSVNSIAAALGVSYKAVTDWLSGETRSLSQLHIDQMCKLFNVNQSAFVIK